jgi:hypothetical protein
MPKHYQSKPHSIAAEKERLAAAELAHLNSLAQLIRRYEAVRLIRGPERDEAERVLEVALACRQEPFRLDDWIWQWSKVEQSIMRWRAIVNHPHDYKKTIRLKKDDDGKWTKSFGGSEL